MEGAVGGTVGAMIVVGVDGSEISREALKLGLAEAGLRGSRVRAVLAWTAVSPMSMSDPSGVGVDFGLPIDPEPIRLAMESSLRDVVEAVAGERASEVERVLVEGPPADVILDQAADAELIVIGQHGRGAVSSLVLGSVSHHVLQHARCPVLVVPAAHAVSPHNGRGYPAPHGSRADGEDRPRAG